MKKTRPPFVRWKQQLWCADAAQYNQTTAAFLLDERIPLDDRFESQPAYYARVRRQRARCTDPPLSMERPVVCAKSKLAS